MDIEKMLDKINDVSKHGCTVIFPDDSEVVTDDPYAAIADYITRYLWDHELWGGDQIVLINDNWDERPDKESWLTTICYSTCEGKMEDFLHDFYEGQNYIRLIAFTSLDNV